MSAPEYLNTDYDTAHESLIELQDRAVNEWSAYCHQDKAIEQHIRDVIGWLAVNGHLNIGPPHDALADMSSTLTVAIMELRKTRDILASEKVESALHLNNIINLMKKSLAVYCGIKTFPNRHGEGTPS